MPLDSAYCNALLLAYWSVCQKPNHYQFSSVQFSYVALYALLYTVFHKKAFFLFLL